MTTWKQKYTDLEARFNMAHKVIEEKNSLLEQSLGGQLHFEFRCKGYYSDEYSMIYRAKTGQIIVHEVTAQSIWVYKDLEDIQKFYSTLSDLPHNVEMRSKLALMQTEVLA